MSGGTIATVLAVILAAGGALIGFILGRNQPKSLPSTAAELARRDAEETRKREKEAGKVAEEAALEERESAEEKERDRVDANTRDRNLGDYLRERIRGSDPD